MTLLETIFVKYDILDKGIKQKPAKVRFKLILRVLLTNSE